MEDVVITRLDNIPNGKPSLEHVHIHLYPFDTLPLLESHLHPKFIIFDTGNKLRELGRTAGFFKISSIPAFLPTFVQ